MQIQGVKYQPKSSEKYLLSKPKSELFREFIKKKSCSLNGSWSFSIKIAKKKLKQNILKFCSVKKISKYKE